MKSSTILSVALVACVLLQCAFLGGTARAQGSEEFLQTHA
jgi:hypothetical protein